MSDDFNVRKFPEVMEEAKGRRTLSEGSVQPPTPTCTDDGDGTPSRMYKLFRRLSSTAVIPTDSVSHKIKPALPELPDEDDTCSQNDS